MALPRLTTSDYPQDARTELGKAVTRAREAGGWPRRRDFALEAGISLRSLAKLESGEEGVGRRVLESVGRALPNWTEDTPYEVLDGGPVPPTGSGRTHADVDAIPPGWSDEQEQRWKIARDVLPGLLGFAPGKPLTRQRFLWVQDEVMKLLEAERAAGVVTRSDYS